MQEDLETLLALQRANIVPQYHQVRPRRDHRHYTPTTGGTIPARAGAPSRVSAGPATVEGHRPPGLSAMSPLDTSHPSQGGYSPFQQGLLQGQGAARPQPPRGQETPPGDPSVDKWIKMLKRWDHYLPSEKLRLRVFKGVPPQVREQVWLRLLKVNQVKARNAGKYQEMKEAALVSSWDIMQINLDVNRTFRSHTMFWDHYGVGQRALFHVLAAYSVYDTEVGYCQGMSKIAAILLTFLPEEDAFWALAQLMTIDRHAMHGFFIPGFQKLLRFQAHLERVLERAVPDLKKHMDEEQMSTGIYTPKWFPQCFLSRTPFSLTLKLWDVYTGWGAGAHGHCLHHPQGAQE